MARRSHSIRRARRSARTRALADLRLRSLLVASPRRAVNPANALLNYLYSLLEAEARLALLAVGCDLGFSVIHAEQPYRDSFALDLMEPARPHVDAFVLDLLKSHTFDRSDFFEMRDGGCRLDADSDTTAGGYVFALASVARPRRRARRCDLRTSVTATATRRGRA